MKLPSLKCFIILLKQKYEYIIFDYRSIPFENIGLIKDLESITKEYYDYKNVLSIKKYLKDDFFCR